MLSSEIRRSVVLMRILCFIGESLFVAVVLADGVFFGYPLVKLLEGGYKGALSWIAHASGPMGYWNYLAGAALLLAATIVATAVKRCSKFGEFWIYTLTVLPHDIAAEYQTDGGTDLERALRLDFARIPPPVYVSPIKMLTVVWKVTQQGRKWWDLVERDVRLIFARRGLPPPVKPMLAFGKRVGACAAFRDAA
jgi:hypothetical protein